MSRRIECRSAVCTIGIDVASKRLAANFRQSGTISRFRREAGKRARTIKRSAAQRRMMMTLRTKAVVHESGPEGALVYRKPSCRDR